MTSVLIAVGSRHESTRGIAERIGEVLRAGGLEATVAAAGPTTAVDRFDAFVIGSGVYMGSWLDAPLELLRRNQATLATRPTWLFSSGPLAGSSKETDDADPVTNALGPAEGPGSGGRRKMEELAAGIPPPGHEGFFRALGQSSPPQALSQRRPPALPRARE